MLPIPSIENLHTLEEPAFSVLTEPYRRELRVHCYRMLGSVQEAEDGAQETLWRAWRRRETYAGRGSLRAWLYRIATNYCLDVLKQRPRRSLPVAREAASSLDQPIPASIYEPIWLEPFPTDLLLSEAADPATHYAARETISLAFLTALHLLPPRQRAVVILRDVLEWPAREVAEALGQTVGAVKSALHRARATLAQHSRRPGAPPPEAELREQLERYVRAWEEADVDGLVALLTEDATFSMPPIPSWYQGPEEIARLVSRTVFGGAAHGRWRLLPTGANGQPAFGLYKLKETGAGYEAYGVQVITFSGTRLADILTSRVPALLGYFGLPAALPA